MIDERSAYRLSALKTTDAGAYCTIPGLGFTEVTVTPTPDTASSPVIRDNDNPGGPGWSFPSERDIRSEGCINERPDTDPVLGPEPTPEYIYKQY